MTRLQSLAAACVLTLAPQLHAAPVISEFMAANDTVLADVDGDFPDWIELHNPDATPYDLTGHFLTDNAGDLDRWPLPSIILAPGQRLIIFASNKDRRDPAAQLHTNFRLDADGSYLGLIAPDRTTPLSHFSPSYPPQEDDESFGFGTPGATTGADITPAWSATENFASIALTTPGNANLLSTSDSLDVGTSNPDLQFYMWFDFSSGLAALNPGDDVTSATLSWSGSSVTPVFGNNAAPSSRIGVFTVPDDNLGITTVGATHVGNEITSYYNSNAPVDEVTVVRGTSANTTWDITDLVQDWLDNPGAPRRGQVMILNNANPFFMDWDVSGSNYPLITASANTVSSPDATPDWTYFNSPTPGSPNSAGTRAGAYFGDSTTEDPPQPSAGPLSVTADMRTTNSPVASVRLYYRLDYGAESSVLMNDAGTGSDPVAGDGRWTGDIPASHLAPGEMTRWRFVATDTRGSETQLPEYPNPDDSHRYFGTVTADPDIQTNLHVLHWFTQSPSGANSTSGSRGSVYYRGEFYDNVYFNRHGQSTGGFPKKSFNIDFNKTDRFRWSPDAPRVADIDLLTNWADKSKVRHSLAWEIMRESGVHAHFCFTVRVEQNGEFFSTADFVEDADNNYLERAGLNPDGALYKVYSNTLTGSANSGFEKKNRKYEDNSDLQALIDNLALSGSALENYLYDNIDIPKTINFLAANTVARNVDVHRKNWYIYRDTGRTDEWAILPWDLDLSGGRTWNSTNTYFDNNLYKNGGARTATSIRLVSHLFNNPDTRSMILRRVRTLTDRFLNPPGTPYEERWYENRIDELVALIDPPEITPSDARRDFEKWGSWIQGSESSALGRSRGAQVFPGDSRIDFDPAFNFRNGTGLANTHDDIEDMAKGVWRWKNEYLPERRSHIYNTQIVGRGGEIPTPQVGGASFTYTPLLTPGATAQVLVPTDDRHGVNWIGNPALEPYDTTGWRTGPTGVGYERGNGYQSLIGVDVNAEMSSNASVYIRVPFQVADRTTFDSLELRIQYDDGFIAYLNGFPVASDNNPVSPAWNDRALGNGTEVSPGSPSIFDISPHLSRLRNGNNILAIHGLNQSTGSSDMIIMPEIYGGVTVEATSDEPLISITEVDFNPASGNQDEEYIKFENNNNLAVDISDWTVTGGVGFTFEPGTVIPAGGSLYISPDVNAFRARTSGPRGGQGLFLRGAYSGHLSSFGETLNLNDTTGTLNSTFTYVGEPSDTQRYLAVTELMYHPAGDGLAEFIELTNLSETVTLDLGGVTFTDGVDFAFTGSAVTSLAPGARVLVVRDAAAFQAIHGAGHPVAGEFGNFTSLSNGGETVKIEDPENGTIKEFTYNDKLPWPEAADGDGYSLVLRNPASNPDPDEPTNWRLSTLPGGNPADTDAVNPPTDPDALLAHALGGDLSTFALAGTTLTHPVNLAADTVTVVVQVSHDLLTWTGIEVTTLATDPTGDGHATVTLQLPPGLTAPFLRLKLSTP